MKAKAKPQVIETESAIKAVVANYN